MRKFLMIAALAAVPTAGAAFENKAECLQALAAETRNADAHAEGAPYRADTVKDTPDAPNEDTEAYRAAWEQMAKSTAAARDALFNICARY